MKDKVFVLPLLILILILTAIIAIMLGGTKITASDAVNALLNPGAASTASTIIWQIRIPRVILGILVGMGLAISGCVFQGMLRNPLADPYTLGISGGAALGATIAIASGLLSLSLAFLPLCAFMGALACLFLVYSIASRYNFSVYTLILCGVIMGFLFSSVVLLIVAVSDANKIHSTIMWLMGDLSWPQKGLIWIAGLFITAGSMLLTLMGREIDLLTLGEEKAQHLGLNPERNKKALFVIASFITGACVSVSGTIGFVGLVIPHILRRFTGPAHTLLVPASAAGGAVFLVLCDTIARIMLYPVELPVGVITGIFGGMFFLVLLIFKQGVEC